MVKNANISFLLLVPICKSYVHDGASD